MTITTDLSGKTAFITGASSGLGKRFAICLSSAGATVVATARRTDRLTDLVSEIAAAGGQAVALPMDVTRIDEIADVVAQAESAAGSIDILVNNSGVSQTKPILQVNEDDFDFVVDTNTKGSFFVAQAVARRMIDRGNGGRILNIASALGLKPVNQLATYCMSKAAIIQMTRAMALEWARHNINVNAICPGYIETEMNAAHWQTEQGQKFIQTFPRKRVGDPADLDGLILLLADDSSRFINGAVIPVDDGYLAVS